jgi:hypothetical protein
MRPGFMRRVGTGVIVFAVCAAGCGKKGPPLPPLVKLPVAPADLTATRRADTVELQFVVPDANTDNTRPANVASIEIYALTTPAAVPEAEVLSGGTRVATVAVKAPLDPTATYDPDDPSQSESDVAPPEGDGLDQGSVARVRETLTDDDRLLTPTAQPGEAREAPGGAGVRTYVGVPIATNGRRGPPSRGALVPLGTPPPAPPEPEVTYDESAVTVTWQSPAADPSESTPLAYNVYETADASETGLTAAPVEETTYADSRMTWGAMRCYRVRSVRTVEGLRVESEASPAGCVTLIDTFPPAAPAAPRVVAAAGSINLIWEANPEPDLAGYVLSRGVAPADELSPITVQPIGETAFQDRVEPGVRYVYELRAVDRSGNISPPSARVEETAR